MKKFTDEYFIKLTMDYDKRDDDIYPKWAVWCAKSNDKYYIDGKDGHFYTHVRTDEEIKVENKRRELLEFCMQQRIENDKEENTEPNAFFEYDAYIHKLMMDENVLTTTPKTFKEWKEERE